MVVPSQIFFCTHETVYQRVEESYSSEMDLSYCIGRAGRGARLAFALLLLSLVSQSVCNEEAIVLQVRRFLRFQNWDDTRKLKVGNPIELPRETSSGRN